IFGKSVPYAVERVVNQLIVETHQSRFDLCLLLDGKPCLRREQRQLLSKVTSRPIMTSRYTLLYDLTRLVVACAPEFCEFAELLAYRFMSDDIQLPGEFLTLRRAIKNYVAACEDRVGFLGIQRAKGEFLHTTFLLALSLRIRSITSISPTQSVASKEVAVLRLRLLYIFSTTGCNRSTGPFPSCARERWSKIAGATMYDPTSSTSSVEPAKV
ncbi:hypothetical protein BDV98DRAFT_572159, partial [Pterulicium gracile]